MSESLPGYDEWKTTDPRDYEPEEPLVEEDPDDARDRAIENKRVTLELDTTFTSLLANDGHGKCAGLVVVSMPDATARVMRKRSLTH